MIFQGELKCNEYSNYDCYVIDSSGYVVMSRDSADVGQFFGSVGPGKHAQQVMQAFVDKNVFEYTEVFNYQALCPNSILDESQENCAYFIETVSEKNNNNDNFFTLHKLVLD